MLTVKLRPTAVLDAQHGGFTAGWSPVSWGSIDELFVNLTIPNGGGGDGAPQRLISAWSSLRSTISSRPQRVFNALGHLIANEGYDEGKRLQI